MTTRSQATAAPFPLKLGDRVYRLAPLTDRDIGELDNWLRARVIRTAREGLDGASPEERREIMQAAIEVASTLTWLSPRGAALMATLDGMAQLVWQSTRRHDPDASVDEIRASLMTPEVLQEANAAFELLNLGGRKKRPKKGAQSQRKRSSRRGKTST